MSERYCKRGHDTWQCGRNHSGWCQECSKAWKRSRERGALYHAVRTMREHGDRVTPTRLRRLTNRDEAAAAWCHRWSVSSSAAMHAANRLFETPWITIDQADRWCVTLNTPGLAVLYPEVYVPKGDLSLTGKFGVKV